MLTETSPLPRPYGPVEYSAAWPWVGCALLVLVIAWYAWLLLPSHRPAPVADADTGTSADDCLTELDRIEDEHAAGRLTSREAHQQVSAAVRTFVDERTGSDLSVRTLATIPAEADGVRQLVAAAYPHEFSERSDSPTGVIEHARQVVARCR